MINIYTYVYTYTQRDSHTHIGCVDSLYATYSVWCTYRPTFIRCLSIIIKVWAPGTGIGSGRDKRVGLFCFPVNTQHTPRGKYLIVAELYVRLLRLRRRLGRRA